MAGLATPGADRRGGAPQSVTRVIRILEALTASSAPMSLADLSRALATPKSSLAALLRGLADEDFVAAADGAWQLGPGAFGLGSALVAARARLQSSDIIRDGMRRLAGASGETVLLGVADADAGMMTYVEVIESRNAVRFAVSPGDRRPLYATAGGRVLLSARSEDAVASYLAGLRPEKLAPATAVDKADLAAAIAQVKAQGFAQTVDQAADGVTGTAALLRDAGGGVAGALVVAAPSARSQHRHDELARLVVGEAAAISRGLGHRAAEPQA